MRPVHSDSMLRSASSRATWFEPRSGARAISNGDWIVDGALAALHPARCSASSSVAGRPWDALRDSLIAEYQAQLKNPSIILTPLRRVQVLGEVTRPGQYLADPTLSLAGLIALAGGATADGDLHRVRVVRAFGQTIIKSASIEGLLLHGGVHSDDQVFVDRTSVDRAQRSLRRVGPHIDGGIIITIIHR